MAKMADDPGLVWLSVDVYRLLLTAYPSKFRREYGQLMAQVYRDLSMGAYRRSGLTGMLALWGRTLIDLVTTAFGEYLEREAHMTKSNFIRWSGWAMIASAILFPLSFIGSTLDIDYSQQIGEGGIVIGPILLAIGMLGLRSRYGQQVGTIGRTVLLVGAIAGLVGWAVLAIEWYAFYGFVILLFGSLALFGAIALRTKPFSRWNGLPLIAALPFIGLIEAVSEGLTLVLLAIFGVGLALLGYTLQTESKEQQAAHSS